MRKLSASPGYGISFGRDEEMGLKKHIIFVVRYSVLLPLEQAGWRVARNASDLEEYANKLFDPARLQSKLQAFQHIPLASLASQESSDATLRLLVLASDAMPDAYLRQLEEALEKFGSAGGMDWEIALIRSPLGEAPADRLTFGGIGAAFRNFVFKPKRKVGEGDLVASVRLDDDDALATDYSSSLAELMTPTLAGCAASFPCGFEAWFDKESHRFSDFRSRYFPKIALGLAFIDLVSEGAVRSVMALGDHITVDERVPLVMDARRPMYVRGRSEFNDTGLPEFLKRLPRPSSISKIKDSFPFLKIADEAEYPNTPEFSWVKTASASEALFRLKEEISLRDRKIRELEAQLK